MARRLLDRLRRAKTAKPEQVLSPDAGLTTGPRGESAQTLEQGEMPFLDHLEEFRWRILKSLIGIVMCTGACLFFADWVVNELLLGPTRAGFFMYQRFGIEAVDVVLQNRTVTGQFFAYFGTVIATGLILSSPLVIHQAWKFIEPGLYPNEKKGLRFTAAFATMFFVAGVCFGYLILTPFALQFFAQFEISPDIVNEFDISKYFSMVLAWSFGSGALFELPVAVYFLAKLGIATPEILRKGRRYSIIVILILSAVFTPPDPLSQVIISVPLFGLYELSIWIAHVVDRKRRKQLVAESRDTLE